MRTILLFLLIFSTLGAKECGRTTEPEEPLQVSIPNIQLECVPHGGGSFGKHCTGFVDVSVTPAFRSGHRFGVILNSSAIGGETTATGAVVNRVPIAGDAIGCPFQNPSHVGIHDDQHKIPNAIAVVQITWTTGTRCANW